ncbi:MAG: hypothetical protein JNL74_20360 [Fibrobacteres bacterium]|nr:hypothetical protein [Fibrobacterota bacterium]
MKTFLGFLTIAGMFFVEYLFLQSDAGQNLIAEGYWSTAWFITIPFSMLLLVMGVFAGNNSHTLTIISCFSSYAVWLVLFVLTIVSYPLSATLTFILHLSGSVGKSLFWGIVFSDEN